MNRQILLALPLIFALGACGGSGSTASSEALDGKLKSGKELAELGDAEVHEGYLELLTRVNPNIEGQIKTPAGKKRLVDSLLEQELLYKESVRRGVPKLAPVQEKAALYQRVIYGQALVDEEINKKAKEYYEQNKDKEFSRVKVAHILIRPKPPQPQKGAKTPPDNSANEAEAMKKAQEAKAKLSSGAKWQEVVMEYSMDIATKSKGGELGYLSRGDRRAGRLEWNEMIEKAFSMKVGETSDPIKAKDGYHIITLQEEASVAPYEEVQNTIKFKLRAPVKNEILAGLTKGAKTEYKDAELSGPPAAGMFDVPKVDEAPPSVGTETKPPATGAPAAPAPVVKSATPAPSPPEKVEKKEEKKEKKAEEKPAPKS